MNWEKKEILLDDGNKAFAQAPVIISASRSTDIPAFYADWLVERWKKGYVKWKNPFNGVPLYVSFEKVRFIVFWTKNPNKIIKYLDYFDDKNINYYFQYTLNDYVAEKLEPNVPAVNERIETFIELSEKIGKGKVIWRNDPLILTDKIGVDELLRKAENIGNQLKNYTEKMVFSFADIKVYKKVQNNLCKNSICYHEFNERLMNEFAAGLQQLNKTWNFEIGTCAEKIELNNYEIIHNKCIDDELIVKLIYDKDENLLKFLGYVAYKTQSGEIKIKNTKNNKDKGQREFCGCIFSKDIGEYNTCPHLCEYCYANASKEIALANWEKHLKEPTNEMIKGE